MKADAGEARLVEQEDALAGQQTLPVPPREDAERETEVGFEETSLELLPAEDWVKPVVLTDVPAHFERLRDDELIEVDEPAAGVDDEDEVDESRLRLWD